jgi:hypothetical protein
MGLLMTKFMAYEVDMAGGSRGLGEEFLSRMNAVLHSLDSSHEIEPMDAVEVLYTLCKHDQLEMVGNAQDGFAYVCPVTHKLQVVVRSEQQVSISLDASEMVRAARVAVRDHGAQFVLVGDLVVCTVKGLTAWGPSEGDAALRAFAKLQLTPKGGL